MLTAGQQTLAALSRRTIPVATLEGCRRGLMLPLSFSVSLLLLLSSLSLQALALQGRGLQAVQQRRRLLEDQLMAAAQVVAGQLQRQHRCLLPLADQAWAGAGAACASPAQLAALQGGQGWRLLHYRPLQGEGELLLQPSAGGPAAAFRLRWQQADPQGPPQLLGVQELGLRGVAS
jgi:hypothetical protein